MRVNSTELFHVDRRVWTTLKARDGLQGPRERAFHTASVLGNYMVVYGEEASAGLSACLPGAQANPELRLLAWAAAPLRGLPAVPLFSIPRGQCAHPLPGGKVL